MEKSESIIAIASALKLFQGAVGNVTKDGKNPFFKSSYATLENVINTAKPVLDKCGLSFAQFPEGDGLYTIIMHTSGEWIGAHAALELKGHTPQDQGSAITYMRRYALSGALGLATEDDDDGNAASKPVAKPNVLDVSKAKVEAEKAEIKQLCDDMALAPLFSKSDYHEYIKANTGLVMGEAKNADIIDRLKSLKK